MSDKKPLLVICAHPDDECLGAGGTIALHSLQGHPVDILCLTGNKLRNAELQQASKVLGIRHLFMNERNDFAVDLSLVESVVKIILKSRPSIIITHSPSDYNRTHVLCSRIVEEAVEWASHTTQFENAQRVSQIYHMEINSLFSHPHVMVDITDYYAIAMKALEQHISQLEKADHFYSRFYDARTRLRGVQAACERAEAFVLNVPSHAGPFYPQNNVNCLL